MSEQPSSTHSPAQKWVFWLGAIAVVAGALFSLLPELPASLEVAVLSALMVLLGAVAGGPRQREQEVEQNSAEQASIPPTSVPAMLRGRSDQGGDPRTALG